MKTPSIFFILLTFCIGFFHDSITSPYRVRSTTTFLFKSLSDYCTTIRGRHYQLIVFPQTAQPRRSSPAVWLWSCEQRYGGMQLPQKSIMKTFFVGKEGNLLLITLGRSLSSSVGKSRRDELKRWRKEEYK